MSTGPSNDDNLPSPYPMQDMPEQQPGLELMPEQQTGLEPMPDQQPGLEPIPDQQPGLEPIPDQQPGLEPLDHEMLAESRYHQPYQTQPTEESEEHADAALEENLSWIPKFGPPTLSNCGPLAVPIAIPQTAPGIQSPFSRAWAPVLADYGIRPQEFLQFLDHLNVCKAASPPLQVLNIAGAIVGFTPVPFGWAVSMGTSAVAVGGMMMVGRVRITKYLQRVNKEYFNPRGLLARIAKQNNLPQMIGQSPDAPLLAPVPPTADSASFPSLRDRRMQALDHHVALIEYEDASASPSEERNWIDKASAKMTARKAQKSHHKIMKEHFKHQEDEEKERKDLMKEKGKIHKDMEKASRKGDQKELRKLEEDEREAEEKYEEKVGKGVKDDQKEAKKFMFVVIQDLQVTAAAAQHQQQQQHQ